MPVNLGNWHQPEHLAWAVVHTREIIPTSAISPDPDAPPDEPSAEADFSDVTVAHRGGSMELDEFLEFSATDGLRVLHRGQVVFERRSPRLAPETPHLLYSVSKSVLGLLAGILIHRGTLADDDPVIRWVPEASVSAWNGATVRHLLDMLSGTRFHEVPLSDSPEVSAYRRACGWVPSTAGDPPADLRGFLVALRDMDFPHGRRFHYGSAASDLLGWVIERAAGRTFARLASDLLWRPMGARYEARVTVDRLGAARVSAGVCATLGDLALLGRIVARHGRGARGQVATEAWIRDTLDGGDSELWRTGNLAPYFPREPMRYSNHWYVRPGESAWAFAAGVHGQYLFADPLRDIVIAKLSSHPPAFDFHINAATLRMADAIRDRLLSS